MSHHESMNHVFGFRTTRNNLPILMYFSNSSIHSMHRFHTFSSGLWFTNMARLVSKQKPSFNHRNARPIGCRTVILLAYLHSFCQTLDTHTHTHTHSRAHTHTHTHTRTHTHTPHTAHYMLTLSLAHNVLMVSCSKRVSDHLPWNKWLKAREWRPTRKRGN